MEKEVPSILDKRTNAPNDLPIDKGTIRATDLKRIKRGPDDFGLLNRPCREER